MGRPPRIRREELLETARRVFAAKGFEAATLADIAKELRVTPAALLRYVPNKQALFAEAMRTARLAPPECILELAEVDPTTDPRLVLRRLAEQLVPFLQRTIAENVAVYMHRQAHASIVFPFDPRDEASPPRRAVTILTDYFRRAAEAGTIRVRNPRASALLFLGSLQSYVFFHQILHIASRPYPLSDYIDALIDLWTKGAMGGRRGRKANSSPAFRSADRNHRRNRRHAAVHGHEAGAEGADGVRDAGGPHGQRRLAGRRSRGARSHR